MQTNKKLNASDSSNALQSVLFATTMTSCNEVRLVWNLYWCSPFNITFCGVNVPVFLNEIVQAWIFKNCEETFILSRWNLHHCLMMDCCCRHCHYYHLHHLLLVQEHLVCCEAKTKLKNTECFLDVSLYFIKVTNAKNFNKCLKVIKILVYIWIGQFVLKYIK